MTAPFLPNRTGPAPLTEGLSAAVDAPTDQRLGTVTAVTARGITVNVAGGEVPAAHLDSYVPAVGETVALVRFQGSWLVVGRPVGFGTSSDSMSPGPGVGITLLAAQECTTGSQAFSTGAEVAMPSYSLTFYHPTGQHVLIVAVYGWFSTVSADWVNVALREQFSGVSYASQLEPITSNVFGRTASFVRRVPSSLGGTKRTYYMTVQRFSGTGTSQAGILSNSGCMLAYGIGDRSIILPG